MMTTETARGTMIAQEWMINIDAGLIVLCVVFISWLNSRMRRLYSILLGIFIASLGLLMAGISMSGVLCIMGIMCFAVGEMLASPKMKEYLGVIAPAGKKALYMGYANMPLAIGWAYGSFMGGKVYDVMGDKANLALKYLADHSGIVSGVARTEAFAKLQTVLNLNAADATTLLWNTYHPFKLWYIFVGIGLTSAVAIFFYAMWAKKLETAEER
jgi:MFS family permease